MKESLKTLVWDLPVRLFHWLLVIGFFTAAFISLVLGDDSSLFAYHTILGLIIGLMVLMRVIWGLSGRDMLGFLLLHLALNRCFSILVLR